MSENKSGLKSLLDPADEAPEITKEWFETADLYHMRKLVRPGRPLGSGTKDLVSLRLDKQALEAFKATGPGWQVRINEAVVKAAKRLSSAKS